MRSATTHSRNASNYAHRINHSLQNTEEEPKRPQPHLPHTRGTFHRRPQPLYTEKHKVSCSGFLPKTIPCNIHAAIPMWSATLDSRNAKNYAHRNNHSLENTEEEPKRPQPQPPHTGGTFHRRLQPLYTEKYKVSCSGFLPKAKPMQHSCSHYIAFCSITWLTCISLRTWQHQMTTIMQPFQCDLQPQIQETQGTNHSLQNTEKEPKRPQPHPSHTGGTFHRRLQPLYTEKYKVSCSGFLPKTKPMQHSCSHYKVTTSQSHPFVTTSLRHHFPSSPLPKVTTLPSSPLPKVTTLPLSPPPFVTTLCHSLLFFCDVFLCDVKSHTALVIANYSFVMYIVMWCRVSHRPAWMSSLTILFVRNTEVLLHNLLWSKSVRFRKYPCFVSSATWITSGTCSRMFGEWKKNTNNLKPF